MVAEEMAAVVVAEAAEAPRDDERAAGDAGAALMIRSNPRSGQGNLRARHGDGFTLGRHPVPSAFRSCPEPRARVMSQ